MTSSPRLLCSIAFIHTERSRPLGSAELSQAFSLVCTLLSPWCIYPWKLAAECKPVVFVLEERWSRQLLHLHLQPQDILSGCLAPARKSGAADVFGFVFFCIRIVVRPEVLAASIWKNTLTCLMNNFCSAKCRPSWYRHTKATKWLSWVYWFLPGAWDRNIAQKWGISHALCAFPFQ